MKCRRQPPFLKGKPTPIEDIWEVHLIAAIWKKLTQIAKQRKVSYSTVARYCVFRLVEQKNLKMTEVLQEMHTQNKVRQAQEKAAHRHLMCLYGEDVVLLRLAAIRLRISVSALIRLALVLYLPYLAMENRSNGIVNPEELFFLGIKRWLRIEQTELHLQGLPVIHQFTFSMFLPWQWWS